MGAYQVLQHEELKAQRKNEMKKTLDDQRREIAGFAETALAPAAMCQG